MQTSFYDALEARDPAAREASLMAALPGDRCRGEERGTRLSPPLCHGAAGRGDRSAGLGAIAADPQIRSDRAAAARPRLSAVLPRSPSRRCAGCLCRPGRSTKAGRPAADFRRFAQALFAAGFRAGDLLHNTFSYHMVPAGAMVESAAEALGCPVIPAGIGQTSSSCAIIADLKPVGYVGTPSFLKILLDRGASEGIDVSLAEEGAGRGRGTAGVAASRARGAAGSAVWQSLRHRRCRDHRL